MSQFPQSPLLRALEAGKCAGGELRVDEHREPAVKLRRVFAIARVQLFPFAWSMPRRAGALRALAGEVTRLLLRPPAERGG